MKFITPTPVTNSVFVSSTRAENDHAAYNVATTYAEGNRVISTTTHRIYESVQSANTGNSLTDIAWWVDIGPTNRWAMFDAVIGTVTAQATPLTVVLDTGIITSVVLLDIAATSVTISMTDGPGGATVYNETYAIEDSQVVLDWFDYFFSEIIPATTLIVNDLPPYSGARLTVSLAAPTTAECGTLVIGKLVDLGQTLAKPSITIQDYSRKETDTFGVTSVLERAYAKKIAARFWFDSSKVDFVARKLAAVRATPVVWLGDDSNIYESLVAYGFYRDWGVDITYPNFSEASITIEGLT